MKKWTLITSLLLLSSIVFAQKLYDDANETIIDLAEVPKVQYISVSEQYVKSKKGQNQINEDSVSTKKKALFTLFPTSKKYGTWSFHVDYGQKKALPLAGFTHNNAVELCNYLSELGWELITVSSNTTGFEGVSSTANSYIFKRRTK